MCQVGWRSGVDDSRELRFKMLGVVFLVLLVVVMIMLGLAARNHGKDTWRAENNQSTKATDAATLPLMSISNNQTLSSVTYIMPNMY